MQTAENTPTRAVAPSERDTLEALVAQVRRCADALEKLANPVLINLGDTPPAAREPAAPHVCSEWRSPDDDPTVRVCVLCDARGPVPLRSDAQTIPRPTLAELEADIRALAPSPPLTSKLGRIRWIEDDATINDPDHETVKRALLRLTGIPFDTFVKNATTKDLGDAKVHVWGDVEVYVSWPGACQIETTKAAEAATGAVEKSAGVVSGAGDLTVSTAAPAADAETPTPDAGIKLLPPVEPEPTVVTTHLAAELDALRQLGERLVRALGRDLGGRLTLLGDDTRDEALAMSVKAHAVNLLTEEGFAEARARLGVKRGEVPTGATLRRFALEIVEPELRRREESARAPRAPMTVGVES